MESKKLPPGAWISLFDLDGETTEQEIAAVIEHRTGVVVAEDQISLTPIRSIAACAIVSFSHAQIRDILNWALADDRIHGHKLNWRIPKAREKNDRAA